MIDVVCFPDMAWDYVPWTNRQHVMSRLPSMYPDVRVLYVSPPRFAVPHLLGRFQRRPGSPTDSVRSVTGHRLAEVGDRLWVLQPLLPVPNRLAQRRVTGLYDRWLRWSVRRASRRLRFERPIVWTYTPFVAPILDATDRRLLCYDVVDDYPALPHYQQLRPGVEAADEHLLRRADLVFFASERLYAARGDRNPHSHLLGNAADVELFATAQTGALSRPGDLPDPGRPILLFHGTITAYKLDLDLIRALARTRPEWSFVFIGPISDEASRSALEQLRNLHLLGPKTQQELPAYLAHARVSIIPYQRTPYTEGINALKIYECLAAGKPVVTTDLPCFREFGDLVRLAKDPASFDRAIVGALAESDPELPKRRLAAVQDRGWDRKVERAMELIAARLRVSL